MYYETTIKAIREAIEKKYPGTKAEFFSFLNFRDIQSAYLLWMCDEIEKMDTSSIKSALKAARWIGWIVAHVEIKGYWDNDHTRNLIRHDHKSGLDIPHQK